MITVYFGVLTIALICLILLNYGLSISVKKERNKEKYNLTFRYFRYFNYTLFVHVIALLIQIFMMGKSNIPPIYFDYITYIGNSFSSIFILFMVLSYTGKAHYIKKLKWMYVIPVIFLVVLFTNDFHHLFYINYSIYLNETISGPILVVYAIYSYSTFVFSMVTLLVDSIKKSGFFSKQSILLLIGLSFPVATNLIGYLQLLPMTIYVMPIMFIITSICCSLAIFKYKAFNITPVAFRMVIDTMSDAYVAISDDGTIVDFNVTFEKIFKNVLNLKKDDNLFDIMEETPLINLQDVKESIELSRKTKTIVTKEYHMKVNRFNHYFEVDIHPIKAKKDKSYVGTLLLFKDITQHKLDMEQLKEKQDVIIKQQQLVSIGELAGGVAHDINTPISAIKTGIVMLNQMGSTKTAEELEVLQRMDNCATKIINIVNSMRNQIRNLGGDTNVKFKISDVVNDIKVITYHEVAKNKSEVIIDMDESLCIKGDPTKLGQVLTNFVVNAAQAYKDNEGGKIEVTVKKVDNNKALIQIQDYAGGLDPTIVPYIFKNILTTKGTYGTGLGLYLAYSVIKGNFDGDITFDTKEGYGTAFNITIPIA